MPESLRGSRDGQGGDVHGSSHFMVQKAHGMQPLQERVGKDGSSQPPSGWVLLVGGEFLAGLELWWEVIGTVQLVFGSLHSGGEDAGAHSFIARMQLLTVAFSSFLFSGTLST